MSTKHRPAGLVHAIRRIFRTETHGMKRKGVPKSRPRTQPTTVFLKALSAGQIRWRVFEEIAILRAPGKEVVEVTPELALALTSGCAVVEPWDPEDPPPEVFALLTRQGQDLLIERIQRRARRQAQAKQRKAMKR